MLVMLANKHTRNACLLSDPSDHASRGVPNQDTLARTPLWSTMMKAFPSGNARRDPKQADGNYSGQLAQSPQVSICPPPLLGHHPMVTSILDWREMIIWPMKDGNGERTFNLGPIVTMGFKHQSNFYFSSLTHFSSRNHTYLFPLHIEPTQLNPPPQDYPFPSLPHKQTLWQPTPGPSGTQWLEDLFREPSQTDEPPIPGPSPSSKPHADVPTREPEPEVAPTQSMEEPFGKSQIFLTFPLTISSMSHSTPLCHHHRQYACRIPPSTPTPVTSSPHSHNEAHQEFTDLRPALMIPQAIVHKSINQILLENHPLLHSIPFVDAAH
ncbi:hypothetical protein O181_069453 [Austropuccinia psidii MF-1]|uniref:Uncharacterized protein n=1 Tax=Austropuccinia psidii MF-1 TaxID=1389203 RepID=A0A9Q3F282_9BASI|nr:hypothetical protein [Austropuccinia psidii MF-1]